MSANKFTIVAAVNRRKILEQNLLRSPEIISGVDNDLFIQEGFSSASLAYNDAIDRAQNDVLVFAHQDIYFPKGWFEQVAQAIKALEDDGIAWGALGCFGTRLGTPGGFGRVFTTGRGFHGLDIRRPEPVETLDEIVLIIKKSTGLRFDSELPHFHMYGVDLCLRARSMGLTNFAIPAFCIHNTDQLITLPAEFYACYDYIKARWPQYLPIRTSCITITRFDWERRERRLKEFIKSLLGRMKSPATRVEDPRDLLVAQEFDQTRL